MILWRSSFAQRKSVLTSHSGEGRVLSCDAMCRRIVERIQGERLESKDDIEGGGREVAAEYVAGEPIKI